MHGSPATSAALVTGSVVVALYCAMSLAVRGRSLSRGPLAEANHVVMALAMAAMLLPATADLVPPVLGLAVFAALALAWLVIPLARRGPTLLGGACGSAPVHLALVDAAMATMYAAMLPTTSAAAALEPMPAMPGMHGMADMPGTVAASTPPIAIVVAALGLGIVLLVHAARSVGGAVVGRAVVGGAVVGGAAGVGGTGGVLVRVAESPRVHSGCQALMSAVMGVALLLVL